MTPRVGVRVLGVPKHTVREGLKWALWEGGELVDSMIVLEVAAQAVTLRAQVVVYEARMEVAALHGREFERQLFMDLRAAALAALAAIEDALGMPRTHPGRDSRRRHAL